MKPKDIGLFTCELFKTTTPLTFFIFSGDSDTNDYDSGDKFLLLADKLLLAPKIITQI